MQTEILKLLTPVCDYPTETFLKLAVLLKYDTTEKIYENWSERECLRLIQNYERLKQLPLNEGIFVGENPLFAGFKRHKLEGYEYFLYGTGKGEISLTFLPNETTLFIAHWKGITEPSLTIRDFLYHITRYNRTASNPITLEPTENWAKMITQ